jgi:hypothetical protein
VTLIPPGAVDRAFGFPWILLWLVALVGVVAGLSGRVATRHRATADGAVAVESTGAVTVVAALILFGVLALRAAVIFSAQ